MDASRRFPVRVGECVYCGARGDLSDEHVIPYALNGTWKLQEASCADCRAFTEKVELLVCREMLRVVRAALGMRSRRPRERPSVFPQEYRKAGEPSVIHLSTSAHPAAFAVPLLPPPPEGGLPFRLPDTLRARLFVHMENLSRVSQETEAEELVTPVADAITYARFMAKIGLCYGVGVWGLQRIRDEGLKRRLRCGEPDVLRHVWSVDGAGLPDDGGHHVFAIEADGRAWVDVRLLALPRMPTYRVDLGALAAADA